MEERDNVICIAVGKKKVGKTYQAKKQILRYIRQNTNTGKVPGKVLIFDTNMEYTEYKSMKISDIDKFILSPKMEARRILPRFENGKFMTADDMVETMEILLDKFRNGLLVLDDINKYLIATQTGHVISAICSNRHKGVDLLLNLQSLSAITPRLFQNTEFIRFHYISEKAKRVDDKVADIILYEMAQLVVNQKYAAGDKHFFVYVYCDDLLIKGNFTRDDFKKACQDYIRKNKGMLRDATSWFEGEANAKEKGEASLIKDLFKYYGNAK